MTNKILLSQNIDLKGNKKSMEFLEEEYIAMDIVDSRKREVLHRIDYTVIITILV